MSDWSGHHMLLKYQDPETNANKFYRVAVLWNDTIGDYRVVYQWGRVGSRGQSSFKMYGSQASAQWAGEHRVNLKRRKGYVTEAANGNGAWVGLDDYMMEELLRMGGVNTHAEATEVVATEEGGVTFDEMGTLVGELLSRAVTKESDTVDVVVDAATMNAKFAQLREQFENVESEVEFVNTAVRSRL